MTLNFLLTVHQFLPDYSSGTEVLTFGVANELVRRGHKVSVLTGYPAKQHFSDSKRLDHYKLGEIDVYRFHHAYVPMGGQTAITEVEFNNRLAARYFAGLLQTVRPDIVHFFHFSRLGTGMIDAVVEAGVPAYYTPTDFWSICPTSQLLLEDGTVCGGPSRHGGNCVKHVIALTRGAKAARIVRKIPTAAVDAIVKLTGDGLLPTYRYCDEVAAMGRRKGFNVARLNALHGIVSPTALMTGVLTANGVTADRITQSAYGIDMGPFDDRAADTRDPAVLTLGFIGTLAWHKGCHVLIDAFHRLEPGRARLRIYGNDKDFPDYFAQLRQQAGSNPAIEFCGTFPNNQIANVMAGLDVLVVPSLWYENTPLVVYSALAAKRPVVASDFPGMTEVIRSDWNGLAFTPGSADALYRQLNRLVQDPDLARRMSENCARPKSITGYVDELMALYERRASASGRAEIAARQVIEPLHREPAGGHLSGWSVADFDTPARISILVDDKVCAHTGEFFPRGDIRDELRRQGKGRGAINFGFSLQVPVKIDWTKVMVRIEGKDGRHVEFPLQAVRCGTSIQVSPGNLIGLDELNPGAAQDAGPVNQ